MYLNYRVAILQEGSIAILIEVNQPNKVTGVLWYNKHKWGAFFVLKLLVFFIILLVFVLLLEKILNRLLGVEKKRISETPGKNVDRWGRGIILIFFLCTIPFYVMADTSFIKWYWMLYMIILLGFQSILEWKYLKNSKQYITTLIFLILTIIFTL